MSTEFINDQWRLPNAWNGTESNVNKQSNYSMDFDATNQSVIVSSNNVFNFGTGDFTLSAWIKVDSFGSSYYPYILDFRSSKTANENAVAFYLDPNGILQVWISNSLKIGSSGTALVANTWYNVILKRESGTLSTHINGGSADQTASYAGDMNTTPPLTIGARAGNIQAINGQIDAVSIFNYALSSSQITTLYGSSSTGIGNPMSLSPKPVAYYPLGDQDAFNGANYLVPNIAAQEDDGDIAVSYSPYALDFDGTNDYIETPYVLPANTTTFSVSMWVKTTSFSTFQGLIGSQDSSSDGYFVSISSYNINFKINGTTTAASTSSLNTNTWFHLVVTYDGSNAKVYLNNGSPVSNSVTETINITANTIIGRLPWTAFYYFNGSMSNISIWNTALTSAQVTEIYNEGVPSNLNNHSAYSNLVSWWQLGSNSSFNTNWTVLDEKGSNNGTSVNMTEADIVDGVGSYANGLSSGMGGDEVVGDAPYSSSNALSVNMDVLDRVEDTPS